MSRVVAYREGYKAEFREREGFCEIVVTSRLQTADPVLDRGFRTQKDHGNLPLAIPQATPE